MIYFVVGVECCGVLGGYICVIGVMMVIILIILIIGVLDIGSFDYWDVLVKVVLVGVDRYWMLLFVMV